MHGYKACSYSVLTMHGYKACSYSLSTNFGFLVRLSIDFIFH